MTIAQITVKASSKVNYRFMSALQINTVFVIQTYGPRMMVEAALAYTI